jgi:hypothetical protein
MTSEDTGIQELTIKQRENIKALIPAFRSKEGRLKNIYRNEEGVVKGEVIVYGDVIGNIPVNGISNQSFNLIHVDVMSHDKVQLIGSDHGVRYKIDVYTKKRYKNKE